MKYWEARGNGPVEMRLARYAAECVSPSQRLLVVWPAPEIYYYSNRLMAGRHLFFDAGYESLPTEERLTLEKIRRYAPPLVLARGDLDGFTSQFYPGVVAYLHRAYDTAGSMEDNGLQYLILARRDARVVRAYGDSGWPCFD